MKKSVATVEPIRKKRRQPLPPIVGKRVGTGRGRKFAARFLSFARRSDLNFGDQFVQLAQPREVIGPNAVEIVAPTLLNATLAEANIAGFAVELNAVAPAPEPLCSNVFQTPINLVRAALYDASRKVPKTGISSSRPLICRYSTSFAISNTLRFSNFSNVVAFPPTLAASTNAQFSCSIFKLFKRRYFSAFNAASNRREISPANQCRASCRFAIFFVFFTPEPQYSPRFSS